MVPQDFPSVFHDLSDNLCHAQHSSTPLLYPPSHAVLAVPVSL